MRLIEAIKRANRPQPPENSVRLRLACWAALLISVSACHAQGEISGRSWLAAMGLVTLGTIFSHRTRVRPPGWVKVVLAVAAVATLVWFFQQIASHRGADITNIENPLTALFVWVQVIHSFHVPARKDLAFSLASPTALMAVAAAQAIDLRFAVYATAWAAFALWGLNEMWSSTSGGGRLSRRGLAWALSGVAAATAAIFLLLPAPRVSVRANFLARAGNGGAVGIPGGLAGDTAGPAELARPGNPSGRTRIGGYLGFANRLDTALRGRLGNTVVMRVRADRPSYWVGQTFDTWDGQGWRASTKADRPVGGTSPFDVPVAAGDALSGRSDLQTFFVVQSTPDLVFHAESARRVWFPASNLFASGDGTLVSPIGLGRGAVYTVESQVVEAGAVQLRGSAADGAELPLALQVRDTQLPHPYPAADALARSVTANATTTYDTVQALIAWISANTRYSTDIPPLPPDVDTVDEFLFGNRVGFCEQISTSLTVMLRSLGIPAREAVGYVPGPYNPITDLYDVRATDAHAWVQVWFPGYGWQSFDPTADVPTTNPAPGTKALQDLAHFLGPIRPAPVAALLAVGAFVVAAVRYRRRRPATWADRVARQIERSGARSGRPRQPAETLSEYAIVLEGRTDDTSGVWRGLARQVEQSAYGDRELTTVAGRQAVAAVRALQRRKRA